MKNNLDSISQRLQHARQLFERNRLEEARTIYSELVKADGVAEEALNYLVQISMRMNRVQDTQRYLEALVSRFPGILRYRNMLTNLYGHLVEWKKACECYRQYIDLNPGNPDAYFNFAYYLRKAAQFEQALKNYQLALDLGIKGQEEVFLNMAVIYSDDLRQEDKAEFFLHKALEMNSRYVPALFNLANLLEQVGNKSASFETFKRILTIDPKHYESLARLSDLQKNNDKNSAYIKALELAVKDSTIEKTTMVNLYFALGKAYDDCAAYDLAFESYQRANKLNAELQTRYDRSEIESQFNALIGFFNKDWFNKIAKISDKELIFICGMFRSGSTLTEQILAAHPQVTAGGEREFFVRKEHSELSPFPGKLAQYKQVDFERLANAYLDELKDAFPDAIRVTDKRPDNFIYIGLIKSLFPNARIIHTRRQILDNCLSVFFLRLGNSMSYANQLADIAHYYRQQERLMNHWKTLFKDSIFELTYDDLVESPETVIKDCLSHLNLAWDDACINFHKNKNVVKTASVWQVRQPLYKSSSGRWKNYQHYIGELIKQLEKRH